MRRANVMKRGRAGRRIDVCLSGCSSTVMCVILQRNAIGLISCIGRYDVTMRWFVFPEVCRRRSLGVRLALEVTVSRA